MSKKKSLTLGSLMALCMCHTDINANQHQDKLESAMPSVTNAVSCSEKTKTGGKCGAGKCGNEKRYERVEIDEANANRVVKARDGNCGLSGQGVDIEYEPSTGDKIRDGKCGRGVCGN